MTDAGPELGPDEASYNGLDPGLAFVGPLGPFTPGVPLPAFATTRVYTEPF